MAESKFSAQPFGDFIWLLMVFYWLGHKGEDDVKIGAKYLLNNVKLSSENGKIKYSGVLPKWLRSTLAIFNREQNWYTDEFEYDPDIGARIADILGLYVRGKIDKANQLAKKLFLNHDLQDWVTAYFYPQYIKYVKMAALGKVKSFPLPNKDFPYNKKYISAEDKRFSLFSFKGYKEFLATYFSDENKRLSWDEDVDTFYNVLNSIALNGDFNELYLNYFDDKTVKFLLAFAGKAEVDSDVEDVFLSIFNSDNDSELMKLIIILLLEQTSFIKKLPEGILSNQLEDVDVVLAFYRVTDIEEEAIFHLFGVLELFGYMVEKDKIAYRPFIALRRLPVDMVEKIVKAYSDGVFDATDLKYGRAFGFFMVDKKELLDLVEKHGYFVMYKLNFRTNLRTSKWLKWMLKNAPSDELFETVIQYGYWLESERSDYFDMYLSKYSPEELRNLLKKLRYSTLDASWIFDYFDIDYLRQLFDIFNGEEKTDKDYLAKLIVARPEVVAPEQYHEVLYKADDNIRYYPELYKVVVEMMDYVLKNEDDDLSVKYGAALAKQMNDLLLIDDREFKKKLLSFIIKKPSFVVYFVRHNGVIRLVEELLPALTKLDKLSLNNFINKFEKELKPVDYVEFLQTLFGGIGSQELLDKIVEKLSKMAIDSEYEHKVMGLFYNIMPFFYSKELMEKLDNDVVDMFLDDKLDTYLVDKALEANEVDTSNFFSQVDAETIFASLKKAGTIGDVSPVYEVIQDTTLDVKPLQAYPYEISEERKQEMTKFLINNYYAGEHGNIYPIVEKVFDVGFDDEQWQRWVEKYPESEQVDPAFHGTGGIAANMILRYGFRVVTVYDLQTGRALGDGVYITNKIDKAALYATNQGYNRGAGNRGYIFHLNAWLGPEDYWKYDGPDAKDGYGFRSPEWALFRHKEQLKYIRVYQVRTVDFDEYKKIDPDFDWRDIREEKMKPISFKKFINEVKNPQDSSAIVYIFSKRVVLPNGELAQSMEDAMSANWPSGVNVGINNGYFEVRFPNKKTIVNRINDGAGLSGNEYKKYMELLRKADNG